MDVITLSLAKKYANKKIAELAAVGFAPKIVDALPTTDINEHTLYLVPASDGVTNNGYVEYVRINDDWECVGSTIIDFSMIGDVTQLTTEDKTTLVAAINEVFAKSAAAINETKEYVNTKIEETANYVNTQIVDLKSEVDAKVFFGNVTTFGNLTEKEQKAFDIAVVEPLAKLEEEEILLVDSMVGGDSTPTVIDMSETEIHNALDNIIGGE